MCSYEIGHSNNPAIKQSTYKLYQPKMFSALLQRYKGKSFLFVLLDSRE